MLLRLLTFISKRQCLSSAQPQLHCIAIVPSPTTECKNMLTKYNMASCSCPLSLHSSGPMLLPHGLLVDSLTNSCKLLKRGKSQQDSILDCHNWIEMLGWSEFSCGLCCWCVARMLEHVDSCTCPPLLKWAQTAELRMRRSCALLLRCAGCPGSLLKPALIRETGALQSHVVQLISDMA